jgi:hypothetical protein
MDLYCHSLIRLNCVMLSEAQGLFITPPPILLLLEHGDRDIISSIESSCSDSLVEMYEQIFYDNFQTEILLLQQTRNFSAGFK